MNNIRNLVLSVFAVLFTLTLQAQEATKWRIITNDGNQFIGTIILQDKTQVQMETEQLGVLTFKKTNIKSSEQITSRKNKKGEYLFWGENHHSSRYFFGPNGFGLKKGEGYYQNNWVFLNQVSYGITDHFTLGVGVIPLFLFAGANSPIWVTPKVSFEGEKVSFGAGALMGIVPGIDNTGFGVGYGSLTLGNRNDNFTFGLGYGYADGDWSSTPTISLSGMFRLTSKSYFITENYWFGIQDFGLLSLGGRTAWSNIALDYGGVIPLGGDGLYIIPWLGVSIPFGKPNDLGIEKSR